MPLIRYKGFNFRSGTIDLIDMANEIINEYVDQGFNLTLRQLYYQFVARDIIPNKQSEYKRLGGIVNDARLAGMIDWNAIEDRTRNLKEMPSWDNPAEILQSALHSYREDLWAGQPVYVEAWIEKDALIGVLEAACEKHRIPYFSCRGYVSQSEMWSASQRLIAQIDAGRHVYIFHLGDHDPSGVDMSRDIQDRLRLFLSQYSGYKGCLTVNRLALTMDQIEEYDPPPNPAKITDSRASEYISRYGRKSWELDALDPKTIRGLIHTEAESLIDHDRWEEAQEDEQRSKSKLKGLIKQVEGD